MHGKSGGNGDLIDWSEEKTIPEAFPAAGSDLDLAAFPMAHEHTLDDSRTVALFYVLHSNLRGPWHHWYTLTDPDGSWRDQGPVRLRDARPLAASGTTPIAGTVV